ncbi:MAG TPA: DUF2461 domain-containing protein [Actinomycetes bacterium]|jgi:uncharacterized protein (TIGR02453 family)|nr:DUF2461 domain-containing protein [Actinomycetes bacterium]
MTTFNGFPPETLRFLQELQVNNRKDWFEAHRADYERFWLAPAQAFVVAAGEVLAELAPDIRAEPRVLGSIFRINRDTRFSRNPRPYKDHLDFWFWEGERRRAVSGFFVRLTPEFVAIGAGCHGIDPERLARFRQAVVDRSSGAELAGIAARLEAAGYQLGGAVLKRPPAGFASGGPAGRFLLHKALFVHHDEPIDQRVHSDAILEGCGRHWRALAPLHRWLTDNVQTSERPGEEP